MNVLGNQARLHHSLGNLLEARRSYDRLLTYLRSLNDPGTESAVATTYHELGRVALDEHRLKEAEAFSRRALEIRQRLQQDNEAAATMLNLGVVLQERLKHDEAESWYVKALTQFEAGGLRRDA